MSSYPYTAAHWTRYLSSDVGHTLWHLLAARMLTNDAAVKFLEIASQQNGDVLIDDLREFMGYFPRALEVRWRAHSPLPHTGWSWSQFREWSALRSPLEISSISRLPLIDPSVISQVRSLHRVILAAQHASETQILQNLKK